MLAGWGEIIEMHVGITQEAPLNLKKPVQNYPLSFVDCFYVYHTIRNVELQKEQNVFAVASGLALSFILKKPASDNSAPLPAPFAADQRPIRAVCRAVGYQFEIIQKFGGVYGLNYYKYRIVENLLCNKPVLASSAKGESGWVLITDYELDTDWIQVISHTGCKKIDNWYDKLDKLVILGDAPTHKSQLDFRNVIAGCLQIVETMTIPGYATGKDAYQVWADLNIRQQTDSFQNTVGQLYKNRASFLSYLLELREKVCVEKGLLNPCIYTFEQLVGRLALYKQKEPVSEEVEGAIGTILELDQTAIKSAEKLIEERFEYEG